MVSPYTMCLFTNCVFGKDRDGDFVLFAFCLFQPGQGQPLVDCSGGGSERKRKRTRRRNNKLI